MDADRYLGAEQIIDGPADNGQVAPSQRCGATACRSMNLSIEKVGKLYQRKIWALNEFSLEVGPGVLGLLGPNGAGKSTLMRILATITRPTRGRVTWEGVDITRSPNELRAVLGYLPQDFGVYPNLNAVQFLEYLAAVRGLDGRMARKRIQALLELVNLTEASKRPLGGYSGGMKQRVGIAQALLNDPRLLVVDEPTAGLDPEERVRFRNLLAELSGERIVILSTHIVSDVEAVATQMAIIANGQLLIHGTPEKLLESVAGKVWEWVVPGTDLSAAQSNRLVSACTRRSDGLHLRIVSEMPPGPDAQSAVATLEDAYLYHLSAHRDQNRNGPLAVNSAAQSRVPGGQATNQT
jgi:ABC-type multidrug transport system ATPase subunit